MIFQFLGGLGLFFFAIKYMGDGLQKIAGDRLREILNKFTTNPLMGVFVGIVVTVLIQSSSGTTVIVVGLVSAGFMTLRQAIGVIMGANIGTTITAFIIGFDIGVYSYPIMALGALLLFFFNREKVQNVGQVLFGFAGLFIGLEMMGQGMKPLGDWEGFIDLTISFSDHPILGIMAGTIFTLIVQSSSATVGVLQSLYAEGLIPLHGALPILFGENIGTTITAVLASLSASIAARRAAASHVLFNIIGTIIFMIFLPLFSTYVEWVAMVLNLERKMQIAFAHGTFNVINMLIQLPFVGVLAFIVTKLVPGENSLAENSETYIDKSFIGQSPTIALGQAKEEVVRMGEIAVKGLQESMDYLFTSDAKHAHTTVQLEEVINKLDRATTDYLVALSQVSLSESDSKLHHALFQNIRNIERVGDHFENIVELVQFKDSHRVKFSPDACGELKEMYELVLDTVSLSVLALDKQSKEFAKEVLARENHIDDLVEIMRKRHFYRLKQGGCSSTAGIVYADIISNLERVGDHAANIAETILVIQNSGKNVYAN
ncbi:Na/Pi cotransporter family protein [Lysinibacillus yapensis]|uniref:Na/Pi cotransporter family protein n=2 Tax=Ureibacillus yapensis TaxID=2304605 RepID=A0A396SGN8_9BACL|nr:Na/Pi cotransporter family protein [Lysinibacillus yapensis]